MPIPERDPRPTMGAMDVDEARAEIDVTLRRVFKLDHIIALWWHASNPRLDGAKPATLWFGNPGDYPDGRNRVYGVGTTIDTWRAAEVPPKTRIDKLGHHLGSLAARFAHRL